MNKISNTKKLAITLLLLSSSLFQTEVKAQCGAATAVTLRTQTEVNNFISSNCTNFLGYLTIFDNNDGVDNITDLTPLSTLTGVAERFMIRGNNSLTTLDGLESLTAVGGAIGFFVQSNSALTDISGLANLTTITTDLIITGNNMASLNGLGSLTSIGGKLIISSNNSLTDMTSLSNLTSINGYLDVTNNAVLTSLSGLDNIDPTTIVSQNPPLQDLLIYNNPLLSTCEVQSICDAYDIPTLTTNVSNNAAGCINNGAIVTACASLPVEWLSPVAASVKGSSVELSFATAQQFNNSHFEIESSQDGRNYHPIGKIAGDGNSFTENYYNYLDENPAIGKNYYRVKQVDFDGKFDYSNIATAQFRTNEIQVYPNPVSESLTVITKADQELSFYNQLGQMVKRISVNETTNKIDLSNFRTGVYYLRVGEQVEIIIKK